MSNHARGLWGYTGRTPAGVRLTIQATGMGGPSAALVLADLAELGVRRAIRVGTCVALDPELGARRAARDRRGPRLAWTGRAQRRACFPTRSWRRGCDASWDDGAGTATVASLDCLHVGGAPAPVDAGDGRRHADRGPAGRGASARGRRRRRADRRARRRRGERLDDEELEARREARGKRRRSRTLRLKSRVSLCLFLAVCGGSRRGRGKSGRSAPRPPRAAGENERRRRSRRSRSAAEEQVEGAHRRLLGLDRLLAGAEGGGDRVVKRRVVDQRLRQLADRLLAAGPQAVLLVIFKGHARPLSQFVDISLTSASGSAETLPACRHDAIVD